MSESNVILNHNNETVGAYFDLGESITVEEDNFWFGCGPDDDARHISVIKLDCSERIALFMMAVSDAYECAVSAVMENDPHDSLIGWLNDIVDKLRIDWGAEDAAEAEETAAIEPFVVKKGERYIQVDDDRSGMIKTIKEVTEDNEYCLAEICSARELYFPDAERDFWIELRPTEYFRDLRKLV